MLIFESIAGATECSLRYCCIPDTNKPPATQVGRRRKVLGGSKKEAKYCTEDGFVVGTAKSVIVHGIEVPMGTTIAATQTLDIESLRGYHLQVPVSMNGELVLKTVSVEETEGLYYNAYLPYTQENILKQAFEFLGDEYGWAGTNNSVDCSLLTKQVYAAFGLRLPRNSYSQTEFYGANVKDFFISTESRLKYLEKMPAGALLYFPGHIMMYLGMIDGVPYCISSVGPLETVDMAIGETLAVNRVTVSDMNYTTRANGVSWLNSLEKVIVYK